MKFVAYAALLLSLVGWFLINLTTINLLSGSLETRTCGTECVRGYFLSATGLGVIAVLGSIAALLSDGTRRLGLIAAVFAFPLVALVAGLFLIGNFGHLI